MNKRKKYILSSCAIGTIGLGLLSPQIISAETGNTPGDDTDYRQWQVRSVEEVESTLPEYQELNDLGSYEVIWGDTLWAISEAIDYSVEDIASAFSISNPDLIFADYQLDEQMNLKPRDSKVPSGAEVGEVQDAVEDLNQQDHLDEEGVPVEAGENQDSDDRTIPEMYEDGDLEEGDLPPGSSGVTEDGQPVRAPENFDE